MFFARSRRLLKDGIEISRRFFNSKIPKPISGYFDDRTLGLLAVLISVPTAAYIWNHHKESKIEHKTLKDSNSTIKILPPNRNRKIKYLIIGGGTAGFSAIQAIKENDPEAQIVLVCKESFLPYLRTPLSKELWFTDHDQSELKPKNLSFIDWHGNKKPLAFEDDSFYKESGIETLLGLEAVDINLENRQVELSDGQIFEFDRLLIATGADPKLINAPIEQSVKSRVKTFRNVSDFYELYKSLKDSEKKKIVVIGGGFLGSELSVAISRIAKEKGHSITQVFPEEGHMALVFPKYLSQWTTEKVTSLGVQIKSNRTVQAIRADNAENTSAARLILDNGEELMADEVVVAAGVEPSIMKTIRNKLPIDKEIGGLEADQYLQVAPGVFAAGDVVSYFDPILGFRRRTEHFDHAIISGKLAGLNMVRSLKSDKTEPLEAYSNESMFWSDLGPDVGYEAVGLIDSSLTTVGVWARAHRNETPQGTELDSSDVRVQPIGKTSISSAEPKLKESDTEVMEEFPREQEQVISTGPIEIEKEIIKNNAEIKSEPENISEISPSYGKGVVFYMKEQKIVGILLFNLFNRVNLAKEILKENHGVKDISRCVRLFNVEEVA